LFPTTEFVIYLQVVMCKVNWDIKQPLQNCVIYKLHRALSEIPPYCKQHCSETQSRNYGHNTDCNNLYLLYCVLIISSALRIKVA